MKSCGVTWSGRSSATYARARSRPLSAIDEAHDEPRQTPNTNKREELNNAREEHPIQPGAKKGAMREFNKDELELLILGMREVVVIEEDDQEVQLRLLDQFEKELLRRFGMYVEAA